MYTIKLSDYQEFMGLLIDVRHPLEYSQNHDSRSINIYYDKLLRAPSKYLNKNIKYYIICDKGHLSKKVVNNLSYLGYNVIQVLK